MLQTGPSAPLLPVRLPARPPAARSKAYPFWSSQWRMCRELMFHGMARDQAAWPFLLVATAAATEVVGTRVMTVIAGFYEAITSQDGDMFRDVLYHSLAIVTTLAVLSACRSYCKLRTYYVWREQIVRRLHGAYLSGPGALAALQRAGVDNPDQRVAADADSYASTVADVAESTIVLPGVVAYYSWVLVRDFGWLAPVTCAAYFVLGAAATGALLRRVVPWVVAQERLEGDFRFDHVWFRVHNEAVTMYRGFGAERRRLAASFAAVQRNRLQLIGKRYPLELATQLFDYLGSIVNYAAIGALVLYRYRSASESELSGLVASGSYGCLSLISAFSLLVDASQKMSDATGYAVRVLELLDACQRPADAGPPGPREPDGAVVLDGVTFAPPGATAPLVDVPLNLRLVPGHSVLICGPSGVGKSSLVRVLAGVWRPLSGSVRGVDDGVQFCPQVPYLCRGVLRHVVVYPAAPGAAAEGAVERALREVRLERLVPLLDDERDWPQLLSPGEQQRVAFARLLLRPAGAVRIAVLDEATSALDEDAERAMYAALRRRGITPVSVGHRRTLIPYHDQVVELTREGLAVKLPA